LSHELITFERAPVAEVALAVQFEPNTISALQAALFRERIQAVFPEYQDQIARPPASEDFSIGEAKPPFSIELMAGSPGQRYWFLTQDGSQLVQLQHDLLAVNWRRLPSGADYPRYGTLRASLLAHLGEMNEILGSQEEAPIKPNWCEVTYINHITPLEGETDRPSPDRLLRWFAPQTAGSLPNAEDVQLNARFLMNPESPRGRLHVALGSAFRAEDRLPIWVLTLTVRARSSEPTIEGAVATLDESHEWADRSFEEMTTDEMHAAWGLRHQENEVAR
jgi:uncharacterized protein (TIGR04255 family)